MGLGSDNIRSFGVTKSCPLDFDPLVAVQSALSDFRANVFPLTITIGPDEQSPTVARLRLDVVRNCYFVLTPVEQRHDKEGDLDLPYPQVLLLERRKAGMDRRTSTYDIGPQNLQSTSGQ